MYVSSGLPEPSYLRIVNMKDKNLMGHTHLNLSPDVFPGQVIALNRSERTLIIYFFSYHKKQRRRDFSGSCTYRNINTGQFQIIWFDLIDLWYISNSDEKNTLRFLCNCYCAGNYKTFCRCYLRSLFGKASDVCIYPASVFSDEILSSQFAAFFIKSIIGKIRSGSCKYTTGQFLSLILIF